MAGRQQFAENDCFGHRVRTRQRREVRELAHRQRGAILTPQSRRCWRATARAIHASECCMYFSKCVCAAWIFAPFPHFVHPGFLRDHADLIGQLA